MSSCFLDVLCNDREFVNFSAVQLVLGNVSADDGDDDSVAAGLDQMKPNAESYMQVGILFFFLFVFFLSFLCSFCCYETLSVT